MLQDIENQYTMTLGYQTPLTGSQRPENFRDLNDEKLQVLVSLAINTSRDRGLPVPSTILPAIKVPDIYDNAKFEQIACSGLDPKYNGSPEN
jgi:hypothetical protein